MFTGIPSDTRKKLLGLHPVFPFDQVKGAVLTRVWWWWGREWCELAWALWWLLMALYVLPIFICHVSCPWGLQTSSSRSQKTWHNLQPFKGCVNLCSTSGFWLKEEMMVSAPGKPELSQLIQDWGCLSLGSGAHRWLRGTPDVRSLSQILGWKSCSSPLFLREMMNPVCQSLPCPFGNVDLQLLCVDFVQVSSASLT